MSKTAILELDGQKYEFPVIVGSENEAAIDIEKEILVGVLYKKPDSQGFMKNLPNRQDIKTTPINEVKHQDISKLLKKFE